MDELLRATFLDSMDELHERTRIQATRYDALRTSALLRLLVGPTTGQSVWDRVSVEFPGVEVAVRIHAGWWFLGQDLGWCAGAMMDPQVDSAHWTASPKPYAAPEPRVLTMKKFMQHHVAVSFDQTEKADVGQLITYYANALGGVHLGQPRKKISLLLQRVAAREELMLREALLAVGRLVHRALEPTALRVYLETRELPFGLKPRQNGE